MLVVYTMLLLVSSGSARAAAVDGSRARAHAPTRAGIYVVGLRVVSCVRCVLDPRAGNLEQVTNAMRTSMLAPPRRADVYSPP